MIYPIPLRMCNLRRSHHRRRPARQKLGSAHLASGALGCRLFVLVDQRYVGIQDCKNCTFWRYLRSLALQGLRPSSALGHLGIVAFDGESPGRRPCPHRLRVLRRTSGYQGNERTEKPMETTMSFGVYMVVSLNKGTPI